MNMLMTRSITTADQLLDAGDIGRCELIRGELHMMSPAGGTHGWVAQNFSYLITRYVKARKLGKVFTAETGFVLERNPDTVRAPDVSFIGTKRAGIADTPKYIPGPPDLAVEVNSPGDRAGEILEKVQSWLNAGTRLVWVVDPPTQTLTVYHPDGRSRLLKPTETVEGEEVLPGFGVRVEEIFE